MPYTKDNPPDKIKGLPKKAQEIWIAAFNSSLKKLGDEGAATRIAWTAVKQAGYKKDETGKWHKATATLKNQLEAYKKIYM